MSATVKTGSNITAYWDQTFDHPNGPLIVWTECGMRGSCSKIRITIGKSWFKIAQPGLESGTIGTGKWGAASMISNNFSHTASIPNSIPDGDYLIRHEIIDLSAKPTAYYMQCAQLTIFADGRRSPRQ
jgi:cellulase